MIYNNKVYANADEKFMKNTIIYTDGFKLYYDKERTKAVLSTEIQDLFYDGIILYSLPKGMPFIPYALSGDRLFMLDLAGEVKYYEATAPTEE